MAGKAKTTYGAVYCKACKKTHYYKELPEEGARARNALTCPECREELADRGTSCGYRFLGSKGGKQNEWTCDLDDKTIDTVEDLLGAVGRMGL